MRNSGGKAFLIEDSFVGLFNSLKYKMVLLMDEMLPKRLKECSTLNEFKNKIKSWIPETCPCRLCKVYVQGLGYV